MEILKKPITLAELRKIAADTFGDLVKAVVDVKRGLAAIDAELHSDLEALLLEGGSKQNDLWGINLYPGSEGDGFIEFDSMINLRPSQGNMSRGVDNQAAKKRIIKIIDKFVKR